MVRSWIIKKQDTPEGVYATGVARSLSTGLRRSTMAANEVSGNVSTSGDLCSPASTVVSDLTVGASSALVVFLYACGEVARIHSVPSSR